MDRLYFVIIATSLVALSVSCEDKATAQKPVTKSRVNSVVAKKGSGEKPSDFCDAYFTAEDARPFVWPPLDRKPPFSLGSGEQATKDVNAWKWINVWATWCKPCIEEMPRLTKWTDEMTELGSVAFLSADEEEDALDKFRQSNPGVGEGPRVVEGLKEWNVAMGFDAAAPLPLHLFLDRENRVRCVRAGGVSEHNRAAVARLIAEK